MNLYGFETFEEWYVKNHSTAKLNDVEIEFDLSAIPERRSNYVTMLHHINDDSLVDISDDGDLVIVYECDEKHSIQRGMKIMSNVGYMPSLLVKLRESGIEVTKLYSHLIDHRTQIESINEKLKTKEKFKCVFVLIDK